MDATLLPLSLTIIVTDLRSGEKRWFPESDRREAAEWAGRRASVLAAESGLKANAVNEGKGGETVFIGQVTDETGAVVKG
jgi:hypothetical protein